MHKQKNTNLSLNPILFIDLLKQSSYKNAILLSLMHKQKTYFSKKYSKSIRTTLKKYIPNKLSTQCENDNIRAIKYIHKKVNILCYKKTISRIIMYGNVKIIRHLINNKYNIKKISRTFSFLIVNKLSNKIKNKYVMITKLLLHNNINLHAKNNHLLKTSVSQGYKDIVKLLLNNGGDIRAINNEQFRKAVESGHTYIIKWLLSKYANLHLNYDELLVCSTKMGNIL